MCHRLRFVTYDTYVLLEQDDLKALKELLHDAIIELDFCDQYIFRVRQAQSKIEEAMEILTENQ